MWGKLRISLTDMSLYSPIEFYISEFVNYKPCQLIIDRLTDIKL